MWNLFFSTLVKPSAVIIWSGNQPGGEVGDLSHSHER